MFNLPYAIQIKNYQGKKETTDTLLEGVNSDTWCIEVGNELGRLANVIDNQVRSMNTILFIRKGEVTRDCTVTTQTLCVIYGN